MTKEKTILIIDDSSTSQMLLEYSLKSAGFNTKVAGSVSEARKILSKSKPGLILLDLFMPKVSGYDFLKMKTELKIQDIPVIVVSAYNSKESVQLTMDLGASEFIGKPFKIENIITTVKKYVK